MKIGVDISQIVFEGTGSATYFRNLKEWLPKVAPNNTFVFWGSSLRRRQENFWPFPPTIMDLIWNRLHVMPVENLIGKIDVFHSSDWTQPPSRAKKVAPILDTVIYRYPQYSHPQIIAVQKRRIAWVKKEADMIVTISESSKRDIVEILGIQPEKIRVTYLAAGEEFCPDVKKYIHPKPYILAVGTREPRKNLNRLVEAYEKVRPKDFDLIIAGKYGWGEDIGPGVISLGYVSQKDLPGLYAGAKCFVYPSLYEGFGLPVLEAMACGTPVICGRNSSMVEVAGDAATHADVENAIDLADKIAHVQKTGKEIAQAKKFSWENTAKQTVKIYEEVA